MSKMIQVRNVPDSIHRRLKARAAAAGMTLSDLLLRELVEIAETPTPEEMEERLRKLTPAKLPVSPAQMIREERDSRWS